MDSIDTQDAEDERMLRKAQRKGNLIITQAMVLGILSLGLIVIGFSQLGALEGSGDHWTSIRGLHYMFISLSFMVVALAFSQISLAKTVGKNHLETAKLKVRLRDLEETAVGVYVELSSQSKPQQKPASTYRVTARWADVDKKPPGTDY